MAQRVVSYDRNYESLSPGMQVDGSRCVILDEDQRVVSNQDGFVTYTAGSIIDDSNCVVLDPGQRVVSWDDGYQSCAPGSHVDNSNCLILDLDARVTSYEDGYETCKVGHRPDGVDCVVLQPGQRVVSWDDGYRTCKVGSHIDNTHCIILDAGQRVVSWEDGYQSLKPGSVVDGTNCIILSEGDRVVSWQDGFQTLAQGSKVDGSNCIILGQSQRVVSWDDGYQTCRIGSRVDGSNCLILNEGQRVVSWEDGFLTCKIGDKPDGVHCVILNAGQRVVSWDDGYQTCKPGSYIDNTNCIILDAGQRVVSWEDGYQSCKVDSHVDNTNCIVLGRDEIVVSADNGYASLTINSRVNGASCIVLNVGWSKESGVLQPDEYYVAAALPNRSVAVLPSVGSVNFSGNTISGAPSSFSMGGWIRLTEKGTAQVLFAAPGQFQLSIDAAGYVVAEFSAASENNLVKSDFQIEDTQWHYVAASFQQQAGQEGAGVLSTYLDGAPKSASVSTGNGALSSNCTLGTEGQPAVVEFVSWEIWNAALPANVLETPSWGGPLAGDPTTHGLVVVLDFSHQEITSSNPAIPISVAVHKVVRPCLSMNGSGSAQLETATNYAIGNPGPWTLMTWVKAPSPSATRPFIIYQAIESSAAPTGATLTIQVGADDLQTIDVLLTKPGAEPQVLLKQACPVSDWTHIALVYDTQVLQLLRNNEVIAAPPVTIASSFSTQRFAVSTPVNSDTWCGSLQGLSIWNRLLQADEMLGVIDLLDSQAQGLQALFPFVVDTRDAVSGNLLNVTNGGITDDQVAATGTESKHRAFTLPAVVARDTALGEPTLLQHGDYWALADSLGITSELHRRAKTETRDEIAELFERICPNVPDSTRQQMSEKFRRNFHLGYELRARNVKHGSVEARREGDHTVFYYHALSGPEELYRFEFPLTAMQVWAVTIIFDVLTIIFAFAGVSTTASNIRRATRGRIIVAILTSVANSASRVSPNVSGALTLTGIVINILNRGLSLAAIFWNIISYSWWSLFFCLGSLILSALTLIYPPASAAWRLANAAVAMGALVWDLLQKPQEAAGESE